MTAHNAGNSIIFQNVISDSPPSPPSIIMTHYLIELISDFSLGIKMDITATVGRSVNITHFVCEYQIESLRIKYGKLKYFICLKNSCHGLDQFPQF